MDVVTSRVLCTMESGRREPISSLKGVIAETSLSKLTLRSTKSFSITRGLNLVLQVLQQGRPMEF